MHVATVIMMDDVNQRRFRMLCELARPLQKWFHDQNADVRSRGASKDFLIQEASTEGTAPLCAIVQHLQSHKFSEHMWFVTSLSPEELKATKADHPKALIRAGLWVGGTIAFCLGAASCLTTRS